MVLGDRTKIEKEYTFVIDNKTTDTIYIERLAGDIDQNNLAIINAKRFLILPPNSSYPYFWDKISESKDKTYEWPVNTNLTLIRNSDTLDFIFNDTSQITIQTDYYGGETITRTIN